MQREIASGAEQEVARAQQKCAKRGEVDPGTFLSEGAAAPDLMRFVPLVDCAA